jgi:hypothetical protein
LRREREIEIIKEANRKKTARKKVESANKKVAAATKKKKTAANKAAAAGTKAEKAKKTNYLKDIKDLAEAIQGLFEEDIVN